MNKTRFERQPNGDWWRIVEDENGNQKARFYEADTQVIKTRSANKLVDYKGDIVNFTGRREGKDFINGIAPPDPRPERITLASLADEINKINDKLDLINERLSNDRR